MKKTGSYFLMLLAILVCLLPLVGCSTPPEPIAALPESDMTVYYLDVGQADAAVVLCDGEVMMIDGGNAADSDFIYSWLEAHGIDTIDVMVCTHSHEDHVGGLSGALQYAQVREAYAPVTEADTRVFANFVYYLEEQGVEIMVPSAGDMFALGSAQVEVLGPVETYSDPNNTSIVLRVSYGETSFLFTGDMETRAEADLLDRYWDLSATVLKVAHHGSSTSSSMEFLQAVDPEYAVISVGAGNDYGHPHEEVLQRLAQLGLPVYRTDEQGTICCVSDGQTVQFSSEKNVAVSTPEAAAVTYIGNKNSKKFHRTDCGNLPQEKNQVFFESYQAAIAAGYEPCGQCRP